MSEFTDAAAIVGNATATMTKREALLAKIGEWAENNPYKVYGDYRDELSDEQVEALLESRQSFDELWWEVEINASDYAEWGEHRAELIAEFADELFEAYPDELGDRDEDEPLEWEDLPDEVQEAFEESKIVDCSDLLSTCLRNSSCNMVAIPMDPDAPDGCGDGDGPAIGPPNGDLDEEQNETRQKYLAEKFVIDGWASESCYWHETLKVMGQLDLEEVYEKGKPKAITIGPDSSLIFHTSWNGSGCMGDVKATKTVTLPARFERDSGSYGIQAVYGFVGSVWAEDLEVAEWEAWD